MGHDAGHAYYMHGSGDKNGVVDVYRTIPYVRIERILPAPETAETTGLSGARPDLWCGRTKSPTVDHIGTCSKCKARQARSSKGSGSHKVQRVGPEVFTSFGVNEGVIDGVGPKTHRI